MVMNSLFMAVDDRSVNMVGVFRIMLLVDERTRFPFVR
jgi:hypothetical protein